MSPLAKASYILRTTSLFATGLLGADTGFLQNAFCARGVEDSAGTEAGEIGDGLIGSAAALLHPIDHFLGERTGHHAMTAHSRKHENVAIRQVLRLALEAQRIADAVARNAGGVA